MHKRIYEEIHNYKLLRPFSIDMEERTTTYRFSTGWVLETHNRMSTKTQNNTNSNGVTSKTKPKAWPLRDIYLKEWRFKNQNKS